MYMCCPHLRAAGKQSCNSNQTHNIIQKSLNNEGSNLQWILFHSEVPHRMTPRNKTMVKSNNNNIILKPHHVVV